MITPDTQRFMAERMKATVHSHPVDHTPIVTAPDIVTDIILEAMTSRRARHSQSYTFVRPSIWLQIRKQLE